jgi:hypothetical protein
MDQVIALEVQADAVAGQNGVVQLLDRRWKAQVEDWDRVSGFSHLALSVSAPRVALDDWADSE